MGIRQRQPCGYSWCKCSPSNQVKWDAWVYSLSICLDVISWGCSKRLLRNSTSGLPPRLDKWLLTILNREFTNGCLMATLYTLETNMEHQKNRSGINFPLAFQFLGCWFSRGVRVCSQLIILVADQTSPCLADHGQSAQMRLWTQVFYTIESVKNHGYDGMHPIIYRSLRKSRNDPTASICCTYLGNFWDTTTFVHI